jgi:serine/threonine protein kinase
MTEDSLLQVRTNQGVQGTLLRWKAGETLGQGGMGQVLKAFNTLTGELFAVKRLIFNQENAVQNEFVKTLETEINILSKLDHPKIVKYLGSERVSTSLCTYLEYVSGGSLNRILSHFGPLTEEVVQIYLKQVVEGLGYLHSKGVVHRDLKCANILIDGEGIVKLSDFGCSAKYDSSQTQQSSLLTSLKGSILWMAPEVMRQSGYGRKADVWSLGCTAIEMITGKPPWPVFDDAMQAIIRIGLSNDVPEVPTHVSAEAQDFISLCIRRDPKQRPTAFQLLQHPFLQRNV